MSCTLKQIPKALERLLGWIYIMVYLDPASNPGLKPQRLSDKSCTWKENKIFGISCKLLTKKYQENIFARKIICVLFPCATFSSKITDNKDENQSFVCKCTVLKLLHGYIQPSNLSSALKIPSNHEQKV